MDNIVVVGSGAAGVHFALTALEKGHAVTLLDVGIRRAEPPLPEASFLALREELDDPVAYFLGEAGEAVAYPGSRSSYYGFPPSKSYVFRTPTGFAARTRGIEPSFSFARGGLAETWTAGAYEYGEGLLNDFPIGYEDLRPHYGEVARRIGVSGERDDLAPFIPFEADYLPPLSPDVHTRLLLERYARKREVLRRRYGFRLGRSRVATLSRDFRSREGCSDLGRCLWGCPIDAIYSPRITLEECRRYPDFTYRSGLLVSHFEYADGGRVHTVVAAPVEGGEAVRVEAGRLVLAAGALCSTKIVLDSIYHRTGRVERATGLMDNRQIHVPFLSFPLLGSEAETSAYQFHHLAFGLDRDDPTDYVHGQITTLKSASIHPIVQSLPFDLRTAVSAFRHIRAGLAVANVNLPDRRREQSHATILPLSGSERTEMVLDYVSDAREEDEMGRAVRDVKRVLRRLGCFAPPGMTRVLPKGNSAHYAGTLPMSATSVPLGTTPDGKSWDFPNLYVVDGAVLPFLPAVNHTFTLMANAVRVAEATLG